MSHGKSIVECEDKHKVHSTQPSPEITPTVSQLPSPVIPKSLSSFLINYDRLLSSHLINGFTNGFKLGLTSDPPPSTTQNH